jgi:hypothetical protein
MTVGKFFKGLLIGIVTSIFLAPLGCCIFFVALPTDSPHTTELTLLVLPIYYLATVPIVGTISGLITIWTKKVWLATTLGISAGFFVSIIPLIWNILASDMSLSVDPDLLRIHAGCIIPNTIIGAIIGANMKNLLTKPIKPFES